MTNLVPVIDRHDERVLVELTSSIELAREAAELWEAQQLAYALMDDRDDLLSRIFNRMTATGRKKAFADPFLIEVTERKFICCRCHDAVVATCQTALKGEDVATYLVTLPTVKVTPKWDAAKKDAAKNKGAA